MGTWNDLRRRLIGNVQASLDRLKPPAEIVEPFLELSNVELGWMVTACRDEHPAPLLAVNEPVGAQQIHSLLQCHQRNTPLTRKLATRRQLRARGQLAGLYRSP